jgi:hypothetical protein
MTVVVKAMGVPLRGVEVLSVIGTKVVGTTRSDGDGKCEVEAGATSIAARFTDPFLGVVVRPVVDGGAEIDLDRADIVRIAGTVHVPDGATFDWVDIKLTPRVELPPTVVLRDDDGLREAYWIRRYTQASFEIRVLKGLWEVRASREIDGGLSVRGPKNLQLGSVDCDGQQPAAKFMGFEVQIQSDAKLELQMTVTT